MKKPSLPFDLLLVLLAREVALAPDHLSPRPERAPISIRLLAHIQRLNVRGFERLMARLFETLGYQSVTILRDHQVPRRSHKGRNHHGGIDLTAIAPTALGGFPVAIQVKQYSRSVSRRFVDELRGSVLRASYQQGILVTTSTFAPTARACASKNPVGPIELIDGERLCELLVRYRIGIKYNRKKKLRIDRRYFKRLQMVWPASSSEQNLK